MSQTEGQLNPSYTINEDDGEDAADVNKTSKKLPVGHEFVDKIPLDIIYGIDDVPPWYMCCLLGMQQYTMFVGSTITIPFILTPLLCITEDDPARGKIVSSIIFVSGIVTLLQSTFGVRLPIVQGGTFAFLLPTIAILTTVFPSCDTYDFSNMTIAEKDELWMIRMREIQGAIIVSSLFQVVVGFTGFIGFLLTWITPLGIVPTVTLVGLSLFGPAAEKASGNWYIAFMTAALLILFSQYIANVVVPFPTLQKGKKIAWKRLKIFKLFPVILSLLLSWGICGILTASGALAEDSLARTDRNLVIVDKSPWFYVPYPFQWGVPTVSVSGVFGMLAGVCASLVESLGDYYACARLSGAEPPPKHAINRAIGIEGIGCIIAGVIGTGNGTTSYSQNVGAIRVTKVASRRVIQTGSIIMIIFGIFGKFGASFVTLPSPVVGGIFFVLFAIITAVGLSNLQVVDLNSSRNLFVLGISLFCGVSIPEWLKAHPDAIQTGNEVLNQVLRVLLTTYMFVGGFIGIVFDNTLSGTDEERGLHLWNKHLHEDSTSSSNTYDLPFGMEQLKKLPICSKIPFCPTYLPERKTQKSSIFSRIRERAFGKGTRKFSPKEIEDQML